ncbi:MAG: efflux RND transporter periplasmic adaptor subunit [Acidobacteria bacterium]|nr:efflux RND transporter periplasmic adaptor subunit [Acidobacteriota bacterium]
MPLRFHSVLSGLTVLALAGAASGCDNSAASAPAATSAPLTIQLAPENVATATMSDISAGPTISGQLTPAREATVRAQVGGSIVALNVDRGQPVRTGTVLARISSRDLDMALESSNVAVKSSETALAVATAELQRTEVLVKGGALAARDLEQARNAVSNAEAQVAAARARRTSVTQQIEDTSITAPFSGIVSSRHANLGDVVAPGAELLTIIDPSSLRLEASVRSDQIHEVRRGATARFSIRGVPGEFTGIVDRISPAADPVTRQVSLYVSVPNVQGRLIAGLFADGRIEATNRRGIVVPLSAVDETGPTPTVTRIRPDGTAERATVTLGVRMPDAERVEVIAGLAEGDVLVVGSSKAIAPGTRVKVIG